MCKSNPRTYHKDHPPLFRRLHHIDSGDGSTYINQYRYWTKWADWKTKITHHLIRFNKPWSIPGQEISGISNSLSLVHLLINTSASHSNCWHLFNSESFYVKPTLSTPWAHINKLSLIRFYVPSIMILHPQNTFLYLSPWLLLEYVDF